MINEIMRSEYGGLFIISCALTTAFISYEVLKTFNACIPYGYSMTATSNYGNLYFTPGANPSGVQMQTWR